MAARQSPGSYVVGSGLTGPRTSTATNIPRVRSARQSPVSHVVGSGLTGPRTSTPTTIPRVRSARPSPVSHVVGSGLTGPRTSTPTTIPRVRSVARRSSPLTSVGTRATIRLPTTTTRAPTTVSNGVVRRATASTRTVGNVSTRTASVAVTRMSTSTRRSTARGQQNSSTSPSIPAMDTLSSAGKIKESQKNEAVTRRRSARLQALPTGGQRLSLGPETNVVYCPICLENIKKLGRHIMATACGHLFCDECISAAAAAVNNNLSCPICQQTVESKALREIFL